MQHNTHSRNGAWLALAVLALTSRIGMADELPPTDLKPANIVVARTISTADTPERVSQELLHNAAVAEALQGVLADNKLELDLRLSALKSVLVADSR